MATPNAQTDLIDAQEIRPSVDSATNSGEGPNSNGQVPRDPFSRLNRTFYVIGAIAGIGFLVFLFGAYAVPEIWSGQEGITAMIAGAIVVVVSVVAWIVAVTIMISMIIKRLISKT